MTQITVVFIHNLIVLSDETLLLWLPLSHMQCNATWIIFRKSNRRMFVFCWHTIFNFSCSFLPFGFFLSNQIFQSCLEESKNCIFGVPSVGQVVATRMSTNLSVKELSRQFLAPWAVDYWVLLACDVQTWNLDSIFAKSGKLVFVLVRDEARHEDAEVESER